jgi:hypothetical protein
VDPPPAWSRAELNDLRKEYREYSQRSLDKCDSYLNFYVGLLAAEKAFRSAADAESLVSR